MPARCGYFASSSRNSWAAARALAQASVRAGRTTSRALRPDSSMPRFAARLYQIGLNRCVDVPRRVAAALGDSPRIYVTGRIAGVRVRSTLMPRAGGGHRLFVHSRIWRPLGLQPGDPVTVEVAADLAGAEVVVPRFWRQALERRSQAARRFAGLRPATQRESCAGSPRHANRRPANVASSWRWIGWRRPGCATGREVAA